MKYLDFGIPISFGYTAQYLPQKTVTRRDWKDSHARKFIKAFERATADGKKLRVPAIDKGYHAGGKQIGWVILSHAPYKEVLKNMPRVDLVAEGRMCATVEEFAAKYFKGDLDKEVWVIGFRFQEINTNKCLELSNSSAVLAGSASDLNRLEDSNSVKPSKFPQPQELSTAITLPLLQSGMTCELLTQHQDNLIALSAEVPAKISADAAKSRGLTAIALPSGGKCSESSMNADPLSSAGRMLKERCTADVEKWLPLSEWSDTKLMAQSLYRQRNSELHTSEIGFSLLPTATTYPSGAGQISPSGRNKLENTLRSHLPTPRTNDGNQGYNSGKTGGINLTGYLLATPQNANSPTLPGNLKGDRLATPSARDFKGPSPTKKKGTGATLSDNVCPFIQPTESANPQVWGWMMGFPKNWCESVLMPQIGLLESADRDGGEKAHHKLLDCQENEFQGGEIASTTTELLASLPKPSPSPSESDICPPLLAKTKTLQVMTSSKSDEHGTPIFLAYAAHEVLGQIDLDPMSNCVAQKIIRAQKFYTKADDGLTKPWIGKIWLNPAFSLADEAVAKLIEAYEVGICPEALLLLRAAPETRRHQSLAAYPFCELNRRVKFIADGNKVQAPFSTLIFYLGKNFSRFKEVFEGLGNIRLGQNQIDELEDDRRDLLAKVAQLQLELAKKSELGSDRVRAEEPTPINWLEYELAEQAGIAEFRLQELEFDREVLPEDIYIRQRVEWQARLQCLQYTQQAIEKINIRFTDEYQEIINRKHPVVEEEANYTPDFRVNKLVESSPETGSQLIRIQQYHHTDIGWIAECNVRISQRAARGTKLLIKAQELFKDFHEWKYIKKEILPIYSLGSIRTTKGLKSHFPGLKLPTAPRPESTEVKASDGSIWQACKDGWSDRATIKWRCQVLPDGFSRSPRLDNKKGNSTAEATFAKTFY